MDILSPFLDAKKESMKESREEALELDKLASESELLNKHTEQTSLYIKPSKIDKVSDMKN